MLRQEEKLKENACWPLEKNGELKEFHPSDEDTVLNPGQRLSLQAVAADLVAIKPRADKGELDSDLATSLSEALQKKESVLAKIFAQNRPSRSGLKVR